MGQRSRHQGVRRTAGKYLPEANRVDASALTGYNMAQTTVEVLKRCDDNLTRENVMKQAASLKDLEQGGLLPGVKISTSATDYEPIEQLQLMQFKGERWQLFGDVIDGS
jgi:branched-chain amino acid transport system substrate-binding protein